MTTERYEYYLESLNTFEYGDFADSAEMQAAYAAFAAKVENVYSGEGNSDSPFGRGNDIYYVKAPGIRPLDKEPEYEVEVDFLGYAADGSVPSQEVDRTTTTWVRLVETNGSFLIDDMKVLNVDELGRNPVEQ